MPGTLIPRLGITVAGKIVPVPHSAICVAWIVDGLVCVTATGIQGTAQFRSLDKLAAILGDVHFLRANRKELVNLNRVREVLPWFHSTFKVVVETGGEIVLSRAASRQLRRVFHLRAWKDERSA